MRTAGPRAPCGATVDADLEAHPDVRKALSAAQLLQLQLFVKIYDVY